MVGGESSLPGCAIDVYIQNRFETYWRRCNLALVSTKNQCAANAWFCVPCWRDRPESNVNVASLSNSLCLFIMVLSVAQSWQRSAASIYRELIIAYNISVLLNDGTVPKLGGAIRVAPITDASPKYIQLLSEAQEQRFRKQKLSAHHYQNNSLLSGLNIIATWVVNSMN